MLFPVQVIWLQSSIFVAFGIGFFAGFDVFVGFTGPQKISPQGQVGMFFAFVFTHFGEIERFQEIWKIRKIWNTLLC